MTMATREKVAYWAMVFSFTIGGLMLGMGLSYLFARAANGAELILPPIIRCGQVSCDGDVSKFGRYGDRYYARRWKRMCQTGARYEAMSEANDLGKRNPC